MGDRGAALAPGQRLPDAIAIRHADGGAGLPMLEATFAVAAGPAGADGRPRRAPAAAGGVGGEAGTRHHVRPDGHVGLRADTGYAEALAAYAALLGARPG
jgi:hypothetical protein